MSSLYDSQNSDSYVEVIDKFKKRMFKKTDKNQRSLKSKKVFKNTKMERLKNCIGKTDK